jgi:hypothetical protein
MKSSVTVICGKKKKKEITLANEIPDGTYFTGCVGDDGISGRSLPGLYVNLKSHGIIRLDNVSYKSIWQSDICPVKDYEPVSVEMTYYEI